MPEPKAPAVEWVCTHCPAQAAVMSSVSGVGLCRRCSWRKQWAVENRVRCPQSGSMGTLLRWVLPGVGSVPGCVRHPGRLYDLQPALLRPWATGNFQKPYIPCPPWVCEYLYLCVSVEIFRWLFPPDQGLWVWAELARVPHLFQLP